MGLQIIEVNDKAALKKFIRLPYRIYKDDDKWIPPLLQDEKTYWTTHPGFRKNDVKLLMAIQDGKPAGRIAVMIPHAYNEKNQVHFARFFGLEAVDDAAVWDALLQAAENYALSQGATHIHGPLGFNNLDHNGLLVDGFQWPQVLVSVYHKPYYKEHLERLGYTKEIDWVENRMTLSDEAVNKGRKGAMLVKRRYGIEAWQAGNKEELIRQSEKLFEVYNEGFAGLPYMVPLDEEDIEFYKDSYLKAISPEWTFFARDTKHDNRIVGVMITLPSLGDALRKAKGKWFPFGIFHLIKALRRPKEIDIGIIATLPEYFNKGPAVVIFDRFHQVMQRHGVKVFETGGVFETNSNVLSNWKNYDTIQHKRKRVYGKDIEK